MEEEEGGGGGEVRGVGRGLGMEMCERGANGGFVVERLHVGMW